MNNTYYWNVNISFSRNTQVLKYIEGKLGTFLREGSKRTEECEPLVRLRVKNKQTFFSTCLNMGGRMYCLTICISPRQLRNYDRYFYVRIENFSRQNCFRIGIDKREEGRQGEGEYRERGREEVSFSCEHSHVFVRARYGVHRSTIL